MTTNDLSITSRLLDMIARKLEHDYLLLRFESQPSEERWCSVVFGQYENYETELLEADGRPVRLKSVDAECHFRSNEDMYYELVKLLYKTLESGRKLSDSKREVDASAVPEFMIECVLSGLAEGKDDGC